ncbi:unnamed protein product [Protopolystoma xenopodis]|uniref:Uncharacterized protein n=1 Tax=Protopolystoma xenopodis TaxID=117903 RepID=A0A3S5B3K1_9PLAT|nr:unnamed protein product [Protopolystoma xenopodis]
MRPELGRLTGRTGSNLRLLRGSLRTPDYEVQMSSSPALKWVGPAHSSSQPPGLSLLATAGVFFSKTDAYQVGLSYQPSSRHPLADPSHPFLPARLVLAELVRVGGHVDQGPKDWLSPLYVPTSHPCPPPQVRWSVALSDPNANLPSSCRGLFGPHPPKHTWTHRPG